jgi:hypothetical protein
MPNTTEETEIKAPCRACHRVTNHEILHKHRDEGAEYVENIGEVSWVNAYEMLGCRGCGTVTLRVTHWFSEDPGEEVRYYPPFISRTMPPWRNKLKSWPLRELMDEIYSALAADSRRLATMGARTIVDMVLVDKVGDVGTFGKKLEELEKAGFIARQGREYLEAALDAGNAAVHRGHNPTEEQLNHVMDIVENVLESVYVLGEAAAELRKTTPPKPPRPKSAPTKSTP